MFIKCFFFLITFLYTLSASHSEEERARKKARTSSEIAAAYLCKNLQAEEGRVYKVKVHKLAYFANGLHYILRESPLIEEYFEAHQYGMTLPLAQSLMDQYLSRDFTCQDGLLTLLESPEIVPKLESFEPFLKMVISVFRGYTSTKLSDLTHEPLTPWRTTRENWIAPQVGYFHDMTISQELDKSYFLKSENILRFFILPYVEGKIDRDQETVSILDAILARYSNIFHEWVQSKLGSLGEVIETDCSVEALSDGIAEFLQDYEGLQRYNDIFRKYLGPIFVHSQQNIEEGLLSEILFDRDFVDRNEIELFYDNSFRIRTAFAAKFGNIPALYYLKRIFEVFSNNEEDFANEAAQRVNVKLEEVINNIMIFPSSHDSSWQVLYEKALASFYQQDESASALSPIDYIKTALSVAMPNRYKKDLLKRAFYLSAESKYLEQGISLGFDEFLMYQAANASNADEAFLLFEKAAMKDLPEAFFEAGKSILRHGHNVSQTSPLWEKMKIGNNLDVSSRINLGEELLKKAITLNVQDALELFIDYCENDLDKASDACNLLPDKRWALYRLGKIKERQYKLQEAIDSYKASGPLVGYLDAARLQSSEEESILLAEYAKEKGEMLESLSKIFNE